MEDKKMSEADLCLKLEEFYADCEVYKEVPAAGGRCDMYVKRGCLWIAVEAKLQFSTKLIHQALTNMPYANYSYVAVPRLKGGYSAQKICKALGIGVLEYDTNPYSMSKYMFREIEEPVFRRKICPFRVLPEMKLATAGVQHNTHSEFKVTLSFIKNRIERDGGKSLIKTFFDTDAYHYSHSKSARACITKLCREGAIKEFSIEGKYFVINQ